MYQKIHFKASFKEIFEILFKNSKNIRLLFPFELIFVAIDGFLASRIPVLLKFFVDGIEKSPSTFLKEKLLYGFFYTFMLAFAWYFSAIIQHYLKEKISTNLMINIQSGLYKHLQKLSLDFYQNTCIGEIVSRLTSDIYQSVKELYQAFMHAIWLMFLLIPSVFTMIKVNSKFFYIFLVFMIFFGIILKFFLPIIRQKERILQDQRSRITAKITEHIYAINLIKAFAKEKEIAEELNKEFNIFLTKALNSSKFQIFFNDFLNMFVSFLAPGLLLCFGVIMKLNTGELIAFFTYWNIAGSRVRNILEVINRIFAALASFDRVLEFFKLSPIVKDDHDAVILTKIKGEIEFKNVFFKYPFTEKEIIKNFNLLIKPHEKVVLIGKSGAGKSTIFNLLLRFYDTTSGTIYIDGKDIKKIEQNSLRHNIGVVMQDTVLLNATIKENLLFVKPNASDEEIINALKKAKIWDYISSLPQGINTIVGERGVNLSGGQRQRLSIARVFLKNPSIVLLDEATSNLDPETEKEINKTIKDLLKNRTAIIITHKLSTINYADKVVILNNGEIIDVKGYNEFLSSPEILF